MSDLEKKETAYSKTIQEADTIMARLILMMMMMMMMITPSWSCMKDYIMITITTP